MNIIDLSVPLNEATPTYESDPPTKLEPIATVAKDGYAFTYLSVNSHTGTHIDAPAHMLPDGAALDSYPAEQYIGRGVYIDATNKMFNLDTIKQVDIRSGDIVLFHTGMSNLYHSSAYYDNYPAIPVDVAEYLVEQNIKMVGVDMCSVDHEPFAIHKLLLAANVLIIENLTNLETLADKEFDVYALPLPMAADAAPARVVAVIKEHA